MNDLLYKHVLFKDLLKYLKRDDYFSGYTASEKKQIKLNLNLTDPEDVRTIINSYNLGIIVGSYDEILFKVTTKSLKAGYMYIITDYLTIYQSHRKNLDGKYVSWGKDLHPSEVYSIVLIAISNDKFDKNVLILTRNRYTLYWDVKYDINPKILDDGVTTKGSIVYLKDLNQNEACYDFKNILFERGYTFQTLSGRENSINCYNNNLLYAYNTVFTGNSSHNFIRGNNNYFEVPVNNLIGELNNSHIRIDKIGLSNDSIKLSILLNGIYYIDYLDFETLTHLFYAIDNILLS